MEQLLEALTALGRSRVAMTVAAATGIAFGLAIVLLTKTFNRIRERRGKPSLPSWVYPVVGGSAIVVYGLGAASALAPDKTVAWILEVAMGVTGVCLLILVFWVVRKKGV
jgi:H+/Cl- antiporter ClcA